MVAWQDDFNRPDGALGVAPTGQLWRNLSAVTARILSSKAVLASRTDGGPAMTVIDGGLYGNNGELRGHFAPGAYGYGLYFRLRDAVNWWRVATRAYFVSVLVGHQTEYEWQSVYYYSNVIFGSHTNLGGTAWGVTQPAFPSKFSHGHDGLIHDMLFSHAYKTGATRQGAAIHQTQVAYQLILERAVGGNVGRIGTVALGGAPQGYVLGLTPTGFTMSTDGTTRFTSTDVTDSAFLEATRHGFGTLPTSLSLAATESSGLDSIIFTPAHGGLYMPPVML